MKIIISESQKKLISDQFSPYPTESEFQQKDPDGYKRSEKYGLLDLYYPNRHENLPRKKGRHRLPEQPPEEPKLSMSNIITQKPSNRLKSNKNKRWTPDALEHEAKKYNTRGEFLKNNAPAYVIALRIPDFMNKIYGQKLTKTDRIWNPEAVEKEGRKYNSRGEFVKGNVSAYNKALKIPGLMDKLFPKPGQKPQEERKRYKRWTTNELEIEAQKYKTRREFAENNKNAYYSALNIPGFMDKMFGESQIRKQRKWFDDDLDKEAQKYKTRSDFAFGNTGAYWKARQIPGFLDKYFPRKWTIETLNQEAQKYNGRSEFKHGSPSAYVIASRTPGLIEKLFPFKLTKIASNKISTDAGDINVGSWVSTNTEDFKVISIGKNKFVGQSFCNPDKKIELNPEDVIDVNTSGRDKMNDLKMDFTNYYQEAGLTEAKIVPGRERYKGGSNIVLFLDDSRNPFTSKEDWIKKHSQIGTEDIHTVHIPTFKKFVNHIESYGLPKQIIFDHDLTKTDKEGMTGCNAAAWLVKYCFTNKRTLPKWSIISANKYGRCCIGNVLRKFEELTDSKSEV